MKSESFNSIIRKETSSKPIIDEANERLVILDTKTNQVSYEEDLGARIEKLMGLKKFEYFVVNTQNFIRVEELLCELYEYNSLAVIKFKISFLLGCDKGKAHRAVKFLKSSDNPSDALKRKISNWTKEFADKNDSFTKDFLHLENQLRSHIQETALRQGLRLQITRIEPVVGTEDKLPPNHINIVHDSNCEIADSQISVTNKVVLNLVNARLFTWSNIPEPEVYIKKKIDEVIQNELIHKTYKDIVTRFDNTLANSIRVKLEDIVQKIGYSVSHIIAVPSEQLRKFLEGFSFSTDKDDLDDGVFEDTFVTREADVPVRLSVTIEGKGKSISRLNQKYLKPNSSIVREVKKQTIDLLKSELRSLSPDDVYTLPLPDLQTTLRMTIEPILDKLFGVEIDRFLVSTLKTPISERFAGLKGEMGKVSVSNQQKTIVYNLAYKIKGVDNWPAFNANHIKYGRMDYSAQAELSDISSILKTQIELYLNGNDAHRLEQAQTYMIDQAIISLFKNAQSSISRDFGLLLDEPNLERISAPLIKSNNDNTVRVNALIAERKHIEEKIMKAAQAGDMRKDQMEILYTKLSGINQEIESQMKENTKPKLLPGDYGAEQKVLEPKPDKDE